MVRLQHDKGPCSHFALAWNYHFESEREMHKCYPAFERSVLYFVFMYNAIKSMVGISTTPNWRSMVTSCPLW